MIQTVTLVALGGAAGSVLRWFAGQWLGFALGTFAVNLVGSFIIGFVFVALPDRLHPLLMAGLLGGFTTFSAFSLDAIRLIEGGRVATAFAYTGGTVLLSLLACWAGMTIGRALV